MRKVYQDFLAFGALNTLFENITYSSQFWRAVGAIERLSLKYKFISERNDEIHKWFDDVEVCKTHTIDGSPIISMPPKKNIQLSMPF